MAVPFGFSIGDFVAGINLIITCVQSIRGTRGSSAEFMALSTQLESLKSALATVTSLNLERAAPQEHLAIQEATTRCQRSIEGFVQAIAKYQPWLQPSKKGWRANVRKIQWACCRRKDIEDFRDQLARHASSMSIMLTSLQVKLGIDRGNQQRKCHSIIESNLTTSKQINVGVLQNYDLMKRITAQQTESYKRSSFDQEELLRKLTGLQDNHENLTQSILKLQSMLQIQEEIPPQVLLQRPVILLDACGRTAAFHLDFVVSADALVAVLRIRFQQFGVTAKGLQKLDRLEFVLRDRRRELSLRRPWNSIFQPGQNVDMSMVFRRPQLPTTCPGCHYEDEGVMDGDTECTYCGLHYRSVIDSCTPCRSTPSSGVRQIQSGNLVDKQSSQEVEDMPSSSDDLNDFRRVQIIARALNIARASVSPVAGVIDLYYELPAYSSSHLLPDNLAAWLGLIGKREGFPVLSPQDDTDFPSFMAIA